MIAQVGWWEATSLQTVTVQFRSTAVTLRWTGEDVCVDYVSQFAPSVM